jgi:hypothetical protein
MKKIIAIAALLSLQAMASNELKDKVASHDQHYVYYFPKLISVSKDIDIISEELHQAFKNKNFAKMAELVSKYNLKFDVSTPHLRRELDSFAVRAVIEKQLDLANNITQSYNPKQDEHVIDLAIIAKSMITHRFNLEAEKIVKMIEANPQDHAASNKALASIAKRAIYTPGAEPIAYSIAKNRVNLDSKTKELIELRKFTYDEKIWNAKILLMEDAKKDMKQELQEIINHYDPSTQDGARKLTILAKSALRDGKFDLVIDIVAKLQSAKNDNNRALASIAKAAVYIHGAVPIAESIAEKLGEDEYSKKVKNLVAKIAKEHKK